MTGTGCPIWGTPAEHSLSNRDGIEVNSPRAGGKYFVSRTVISFLGHLNADERVKLTDYLILQRRLGNEIPIISSSTRKQIDRAPERSIFERCDGLLMFLSDITRLLGQSFRFRERGGESESHNYLNILAYTSSQTFDEVLAIIDFCKENQWITYWTNVSNEGKKSNPHDIKLRPLGLAKLAEISSKGTGSDQAFVAMWFDESMADSYENGIVPAIKAAGYKPIRIDQVEHINKIDDEIISEIRRSRFLVADFTQGASGARGGVYYEAGFAAGLNIPVIFLCRQDAIDHVHFDTRQFNHILWNTPEDLREKLEKRITAVIGDGPSR